MTVTITGYTAARMKTIEDSAIVGGAVVAGDLILTRRDGGTLDAGPVMGPANNGLIICTSSTRPTSHFAGEAIYETDTKRVYVWTGSAWTFWYSFANGEDRVLPYTQTVTTGSTVGGTAVTLATINIAARPFAHKLICAAFWSAWNEADAESFRMNINVDGVNKGSSINRHVGGIHITLGYSIPTTVPVIIPVNTACAVTVTAVRDSGSNGLVQDAQGSLTAMSYILNP